MSNPYRDMIARLAAALQQQIFCDPEIDGNDLPRQARELLDQPEPPQSTEPAGAEIHYSWELIDSCGEWQAGGAANSLEDVQREGNRYLQTYSTIIEPHKLIIQRHCVNTIEDVTMSNPYRDALAELHAATQLYTGLNPAAADVSPADLVRRLMEAMAASADLLT